MMCIALVLCALPLVLLTLCRLYLRSSKSRKNVSVVVLGDLGRSPRMQYHAISFAREGFTVDLIGYPGSLPLREIRDNPRIRIHHLPVPPRLEDRLPRVLSYVIKALWQTVFLLRALFCKRLSESVLVQNPPAIPTMPVCWLYCTIVGSRFIVDWHNYAHSIMALSLNKEHYLVKLAKFIEVFFGSIADNAFCVSKGMKDDLWERWNIKAQLLYDRPACEFQPLSLEEKHDFIKKLSEKYDIFRGAEENSTIFTKCVSNEIQFCPQRPGFIVSSTSWTEDEDFSILLNALQEYENTFEDADCSLSDLVCVITGKGPLKEFYMSIINLKKWKHVKIITPWLDIEDYPKMLASADLGVCLHTSSSGLDLPMKVVDMFGCGLPVCAYNYKCLSELVRHNENGFVFSNEKELFEQLKSWFDKFPNSKTQLESREKFRQELERFQENQWHGNWTSNVLPYFNQ